MKAVEPERVTPRGAVRRELEEIANTLQDRADKKAVEAEKLRKEAAAAWVKAHQAEGESELASSIAKQVRRMLV